MALDFPNTPTPGDRHTDAGRTWEWQVPPGAWVLVAGALGGWEIVTSWRFSDDGVTASLDWTIEAGFDYFAHGTDLLHVTGNTAPVIGLDWGVETREDVATPNYGATASPASFKYTLDHLDVSQQKWVFSGAHKAGTGAVAANAILLETSQERRMPQAGYIRMQNGSDFNAGALLVYRRPTGVILP